MVIDNYNTKYFTRQEVKKHFSEEFINSILKNMVEILEVH